MLLKPSLKFYLIIKPFSRFLWLWFNLINIIPLTRIKTFISNLLINFKDALYGLTQFLATRGSLKAMRNDFYFTYKSFFRSQDIQIFVLAF